MVAPATRLLDFRPMRKGKLVGFARVELPIGLRINDIPIILGKNGPFAGLPARPMLDHEGRPKIDIRGKPQYVAFLEWRDRDLSRRFSDVVVGLVLEAHPGALDGDPP
jgi:hypothetical protein